MSAVSWKSASGRLEIGPGGSAYLGFETREFVGETRIDEAVRGMEVGVVLLEGQVTVERGPARFSLGPRGDLFAELPDSAYLPPDGPVALFSRERSRVAVAWGPGGPGFAPRRIAPDDVVTEERGRGDTARSVRHILRVQDPVASLFLVEVITPPGHWSSFPPHRHDRNLPPRETLLEETYLFHVQPASHQALMGVWEEGGERDGYLVGDGELVVVRRGYHMVSAAPGSTVHYLNAMAGPVHAWKPVFHRDYLHLVEGWEQAPTGGAWGSGAWCPDAPVTAAELEAAVAEALEIARFAAAVMVQRADDVGARWTKASPTDWATDVDVAIEAEVRKRLARRFPTHRCVGEEAGESGPPDGPTWYVDPVDGTSNYAAHLPWSAFSLGLVADGVPQVGVIVDPFRGEVFHARLGGGAFLGDRPIRVKGGPMAGRLVMTELSGRRRTTLALAQNLGSEQAILRIMGSAALSLCQVAAGRAAGVVLHRSHPWDVAAGALLVTEAGAQLIDGSGQLSPLPASGLVAAAPDVARRLWELAFPAGG